MACSIYRLMLNFYKISRTSMEASYQNISFKVRDIIRNTFDNYNIYCIFKENLLMNNKCIHSLKIIDSSYENTKTLY